MALISIEPLNHSSNARIALWRMTESEEELLILSGIAINERDKLFGECKSNARRREKLTVRILLNLLFDSNVKLSHNADGQPFLSNGYSISISHTKGYAVAIVSQGERVAVDIEYISERALKIKDMFLRADEKADTLISALIHWCAKETVYKLYSEQHLQFMEIKIKGSDNIGKSGVVKAENIRNNEDVKVNYRITDGFVLTYVGKI